MIRLISFFIATITVLFGFNAWSCPTDFTGYYNCKSDDKHFNARIEQQTKNDVTTFTHGDPFIIDGDAHNLSWDVFEGTYVGTCDPGLVTLELAGEIIVDGVKFADMTNIINYAYVNDNEITISENYTRKYNDGTEYNVAETYNCVRAKDEREE